MRRRKLIVALVGAAIAGCRSARAQQRALPLVAFLSPRTLGAANIDAFRCGLRELGYVEGQNIALEVRSAEGDNRRLPALAAELVSLKLDVIVTTSEPAIRAVKEVAGTIPIVMGVVGDAVALGFAQSLAHPGGNLTGQTILATDVLGKRLQMLHEIVPDPGCVAVLGVAGVNYDPNAYSELAAAAKALGVPLLPITVADVNDLVTSFAEITKHQCWALVAMSDPLFVQASRQLIELAGQYRIAASYDNRLIVDAGGLMSYGPDTVDMFRRAARYVDKILKGEKPADRPIEPPTRFQLVVNLKTAQPLGLTVPPSILARADEVIE
jgi:putative tryptophan/tyrosine transport system substrate-binding protein